MRALPPKVLRELRDLLEQLNKSDGLKPAMFWKGTTEGLLEHVERALRPKRAAAPAKARRTAKRATRRGAMLAVRDAVLIRANAECEACGRQPAGGLEVDHFFGGSGRRRALQSKEACWGLCPGCHNLKTLNQPSAMAWLERFVTHTERHDYREAGDIARGRLASLRLQGLAGEAP